MKTALIALCVLAVLAVAAVVACRMAARRDTSATRPPAAKPQGRVAIVFYSQSKVQNTALAAAWIRKHAGGDLFPLEMAEPYPEPYGKTLEAARKDIESDARPALKALPDLSGYDVVFVGSPVWYGTFAPPFATFADAAQLDSKTVAPFCVHGGGGAGRFFADVRKAFPGARVLDGLALRGSNQIERRLGTGLTVHHTEDDIVAWLDRIFANQPQHGENR